MRKDILRGAAGLYFIAVHFAAIALILGLAQRRLDFENQMSFILILTPLTSVFVFSFLRDMVAREGFAEAEEGFSKVYVITTLLLITLFGVFLLGGIVRFSYTQDVRAEHFRLYLGSFESIAGAFVSLVLAPLYSKAPQQRHRKGEPKRSRQGG